MNQTKEVNMYDDDHYRDAQPAMLPATIDYQGSAPFREIVVNGRTSRIRADHIDHAQLVALAFPDMEGMRGTSSMTVSFRGGPSAARQGILAPAERTPLANGETFVVVRTDKS